MNDDEWRGSRDDEVAPQLRESSVTSLLRDVDGRCQRRGPTRSAAGTTPSRMGTGWRVGGARNTTSFATGLLVAAGDLSSSGVDEREVSVKRKGIGDGLLGCTNCAGTGGGGSNAFGGEGGRTTVAVGFLGAWRASNMR